MNIDTHNPEPQEHPTMKKHSNYASELPQPRRGRSQTEERELARIYKNVRQQFYEQIAASVAMPTRVTATQGVAWPTPGNPWRYNSLIVLPYVGDFDRPVRYSPYWTVRGAPIPRIHLNHYSWDPSRAQRFRWACVKDYSRIATMSRHELELTVDLGELVDFAPWVLGWLKAVEKSDAAIMPAPPHLLERDTTPEELLRTRYEWTLAAHRDYERRRIENEQRERRHAEWLQRMCRQASTGQASQPSVPCAGAQAALVHQSAGETSA
jgi:hypothetical protein